MTRGGSPGSEESELRSATSFFARRHRRHTPPRKVAHVAAQPDPSLTSFDEGCSSRECVASTAESAKCCSFVMKTVLGDAQ
jgi:hypothetical protein